MKTGVVGSTIRLIRPCCARSRRRADNIRADTPSTSASISEKRVAPRPRASMIPLFQCRPTNSRISYPRRHSSSSMTSRPALTTPSLPLTSGKRLTTSLMVSWGPPPRPGPFSSWTPPDRPCECGYEYRQCGVLGVCVRTQHVGGGCQRPCFKACDRRHSACRFHGHDAICDHAGRALGEGRFNRSIFSKHSVPRQQSGHVASRVGP
jgi:hypothetical protein